MITSVPLGQCTKLETKFPIVPLLTKRADSIPVISAANDSNSKVELSST